MGSVTKSIRFDDRVLTGVNEYRRIQKKLSGGLPIASVNAILEYCMVEGLGKIIDDLQKMRIFLPKEGTDENKEYVERYNSLRDEIMDLEHLYLELHFDAEKEDDKEVSDNG